MSKTRTPLDPTRTFRVLPLLALLAALPACTGDDGDDGAQGPPGPPGSGSDTELEQGDDTPGITAALVSLSGGTAGNGGFRAGDVITVRFTVQKDAGTRWELAQLSAGRALVSGPSFNYQRVIAEQNDVLARAVSQSDGSYTYTFAAPLPATYLAPLNDTPSFGTDDGEMTGQALLDGTYTLALTFSYDFTVDDESERESDNLLVDFVVGAGGVVEHREVVKIENCNRCHEELRFHGGRREEVTLCVLCHTSGAEDQNNPGTNGGTPGVAIDFKIMIHRLHAGEHLPSVLGVDTNPDGSRNYAATPQPLLIGRDDFSHVAFPAWPHGLVATPRDQGYSALSADAKSKEDKIRTGPSNCNVCHGDPDFDGPLTAPVQGDLIYSQPARQACGSCHDDVNWGLPYTANGQTMPDQANNSNCKLCHEPDGNGLAVRDAHLHPLLDPNFDSGTNLNVLSLLEAGANDDDGTIDPGEKIQISLEIVDDAGNALAPGSISAPSVVISGPTDNYNVLLNTTIPTAALSGAPPFTLNVPMAVMLERVGVSTGALDTFGTAFTPHLNVSGATTSVLVRTGTTGGDSMLAEASVATQNYVDVASAAGFARDEYVVVDDGGMTEEYARIQYVDGNRLWFSSTYTPAYKASLAAAHAAGTSVREVQLATIPGADYALTAATGQIMEGNEFGPGVVLVSYTTDFVMPDTYPVPLNGSPDLGEETGEWAGKSIVDGTYSLSLWSARSLTLNLFGESNSYRSSSDADMVDFLVGSAATLDPYDLIASGSSCFNCHQELAFHGFGRRGFESCIVCHGSAGAEDRPQYVAGNAPATEATTIQFRNMLHKIHMGEELANAASYDVVGFGSSAYPNNFGVTNFGEILFPALPGGVANCTKCHANEAWHEPQPRNHPTEQGRAVQRWAMVCNACHDSTDATAHIAVQTDSQGNESCGVCHGAGKEWSVERVHRPY
ncbi:MAG TPA: hypothetical protein VF530_02635 [Planctomycetota bacterium]